MERLKTGISKAFWCNSKGEFESAKIPTIGRIGKDICWLDKLFEGGIFLHDVQQTKRALTLLITGPPGSGKTTLALELCYRWTRNEQISQGGLFSLYISTDTETNKFIENAKGFGWEDAKNRIINFEKSIQSPVPVVGIWGVDKIKRWTTISDIVEIALQTFENLVLGKSGQVPKWVSRLIKYAAAAKPIRKVSPDILVIDSLNVVPTEERGDFFEQFLKKSVEFTKIIIFVVDSNSHHHRFWEYVCDIVLRLDYKYVKGYYIRTIEIVKARYQSHVWGKHQLKIYPPFYEPPSSNDKEKRINLKRAHPYRKEGGIFIFPSIHYYLSVYKRRTPIKSVDLVATPLESLTDFLDGGIPKGRCTAFIGARGRHKSQLAYFHLLKRIIDHDESGLVISLRDDEEMTKTALNKVLYEEKLNGEVENLIEQDKLEILYYPPGYITPEEFFHRMFISVHRLKHNNKNLTVLFNSLDQLSARFPLCAEQDIFIPGIITFLLGEGVTSIFIGVEEPIQTGQYGLLSMADLIISFDLYRFLFQNYYNHIEDYWKTKGQLTKMGQVKNDLKDTHTEAVVLQIVRFAGGRKIGIRGILDRIVDKDQFEYKLHKKFGLQFTPLSLKFPAGELIT